MNLREKIRNFRLGGHKEKPLSYGNGDERYQIIFEITAGPNIYHAEDYYLKTTINKRFLDHREIDQVAYKLLREKYNLNMFEARIVKRYDRVTGENVKGPI